MCILNSFSAAQVFHFKQNNKRIHKLYRNVFIWISIFWNQSTVIKWSLNDLNLRQRRKKKKLKITNCHIKPISLRPLSISLRLRSEGSSSFFCCCCCCYSRLCKFNLGIILFFSHINSCISSNIFQRLSVNFQVQSLRCIFFIYLFLFCAFYFKFIS